MINHWNNPELKDIFLDDCAMAFPFYVVDIPEKICCMKNICIYFHILTQYKPIIGRISAYYGISIRIIIFREVA